MLRAIFLASLLTLLAGAYGFQHRKAPAKPAKVTYAKVAPILKEACLKCHTGAKAASGLDLTSYKLIMKGDQKGKVVVAGKPGSSRLATVLHGKPQLMPPGNSLPAAKIAVIEAWIKAGAKEK